MTDTLVLARWVIDERHPAASWPRAAAILLRQELEATLARFWAAAGWTGMADARSRHQFIALPACCRSADDTLATSLRHVWLRLTRACHGGTYELPPTREQLLAWAETIERFRAVAGPLPAVRPAITP
jgi:hypothetical protein